VNRGVLLLVSLSIPSLAACDSDTAIFATSTSVGINVDSKPPTVAVAFERSEGFIGPRATNGVAPPAVASIETAGNVFAPQIRQTYATGDAAEIVTAKTVPEPPKTADEMLGPRKPMVFGTGTTLGFKVGFTAQGAPDSLVFGYKRKEVSVIPMAVTTTTAADGTNVETAKYPSVLASIDTTSKMNSAPDAGLANKQFFATGQAAKNLAGNELIRRAFKDKAAEAMATTSYVNDDSSQRIAAYLWKGGRARDANGKRIEPDTEKRAQLEAWYRPRIGDVALVAFIYGEQYGGSRLEAIKALNIPDLSNAN
jgi:hypothetical protein